MTDDRKLPVFKTVVDSYRILGRNFRTFLRLVWIPYSATVGAYFALTQPAVDDVLLRVVPTYSGEWTYFFVLIPLTILFIPAATSWHRLIVLGGSDPATRVHYSVREEEAVYLGAGLKFAGFLALSAFPVFAADFVVKAIPDATLRSWLYGSYEGLLFLALVAAVISVVFLMIAVRISFVFPTAAIGRSSVIRVSYDRTRGQTWRYSSALVAADLPMILAWTYLPDLDPTGTVIPDIVVPFVDIAIVCLFYAMTVSVVSLAYRYLVIDAER